MNNHNYEKKREEIMKNGNLELERLIQNAQQEANREKIYQQMKISEEKGLPAIKNNAIQNIMNAISITGEIYNKTRVEHAVMIQVVFPHVQVLLSSFVVLDSVHFLVL